MNVYMSGETQILPMSFLEETPSKSPTPTNNSDKTVFPNDRMRMVKPGSHSTPQVTRFKESSGSAQRHGQSSSMSHGALLVSQVPPVHIDVCSQV